MSENPWKTLGSSVVYENPWFSVRRDEVIRPDGNHGIYSVVDAQRIACGIIPLWGDKSVTLVGQYRYPIDQYSWEIPEGGGEFGVEVVESAKRELREETGLVAQTWLSLGTCHLSNCFLNEVCYLWLAQDLEQFEPCPEGNESLTSRRLPFEKALEMARNGAITDAISIVGLYRAADFIAHRDSRRKPDYFQDMPEEYQKHPGKAPARKRL